MPGDPNIPAPTNCGHHRNREKAQGSPQPELLVKNQSLAMILYGRSCVTPGLDTSVVMYILGMREEEEFKFEIGNPDRDCDCSLFFYGPDPSFWPEPN